MEEDYFHSYNNLEVHQLMLEDSARNQAYRKAILDNKNDIKGKVVLDVGCGTGILSVYFAQAGASKVYAVEASEIYKVAKDIIKENNFEDIIEVIHSKVEDLNLHNKVDIIVSEWMGFYLLHEGMLNSVLIARDKFLKPGGLIFPENATLYSAPCRVPSYFESWNNVDGISMNSFCEKLKTEVSKKPLTSKVNEDYILTEPEIVLWFDMREVTIEELQSITVDHLAIANKEGKYQGICLWFSCTFPSYSTEPVTLSTGPGDADTHWKQTTIVLPMEIDVEVGTPIAYQLHLNATEANCRRYSLQVTMKDPNEVEHPEYCSCYLTKCILVRALLEKYENESLAS
ncbi:hypothetical protein WA026_017518 [Henosepilachna vigintioctopunctata]|uniref:Protein arginine N-methyltransferase 6 n=1 Tax=Henosepilachna vigintioctopunctata TaxID=420089 RepID=A0AAW1V2S6_9CUCU